MDNLLPLTAANNHVESGVDLKSLSGPDSHSIFRKKLFAILFLQLEEILPVQLLLKRDFDSKAEIIEVFLTYSIHAFTFSWPVPAFEHPKQEEYMKMCRKFSVVCIN